MYIFDWEVSIDLPWGAFKFDEASGTFADWIGGHTLTVPAGSPTYQTGTLFGTDGATWPDSSGATEYYGVTSVGPGSGGVKALECVFEYSGTPPTNPTPLIGYAYGFNNNSRRPAEMFLDTNGKVTLLSSIGSTTAPTKLAASSALPSAGIYHAVGIFNSGTLRKIRLNKVDAASDSAVVSFTSGSLFFVRGGGNDASGVANLTNGSQIKILRAIPYDITYPSDARFDAHYDAMSVTGEAFTGDTDWTVPAGVTSIDFDLVGNGSGGGSTASLTRGGGGGGGGERRQGTGISVTPGDTVNIRFNGGPGAGAGVGGSQVGGQGGDVTLQVNSGPVLVRAKAGTPGNTAGTGLGGAGGTGGTGGSGTNGTAGSDSVSTAGSEGGAGGASGWGAAGGGGGATGNLDGDPGAAPGGGGGGARGSQSTNGGSAGGVGVAKILYTVVSSVSASPTMAGTGTLTVSGQQNIPSTVTMAGTGALTVSGRQDIPSTVSMAGTGTLAVSGRQDAPSTVAMDGSGTLSVSPVVQETSAVTMDGVGTLMVSAGAATVSDSPTMAGTGTLDVSGQQTIPTTVVMDGVGTLVVPGLVSIPQSVAMDGTGTLSVAGTVVETVSVSMDGVGTLAVTSLLTVLGTVSMDGTGTLNVDASEQISSTVTMDGVGELVIGPLLESPTTVAMAGIGRLILTLVPPNFHIGVIRIRRSTLTSVVIGGRLVVVEQESFEDFPWANTGRVVVGQVTPDLDTKNIGPIAPDLNTMELVIT